MDTKITTYIASLVERNPGQMSIDEYGEIAEAIQVAGDINLLVFGCGRDTPLWLRCNPRGRNVFLEHSPRWMARAIAMVKEEKEAGLAFAFCEFEQAHYTTKLEHWKEDLALFLAGGLENNLAMPGLSDFPTDWQIVIVDAPPGGGKNAPGRLQSIYEASRLCAPGGKVFVHDVCRDAEAQACHKILVEKMGMRPRKLTRRLSVFLKP